MDKETWPSWNRPNDEPPMDILDLMLDELLSDLRPKLKQLMLDRHMGLVELAFDFGEPATPVIVINERKVA